MAPQDAAREPPADAGTLAQRLADRLTQLGGPVRRQVAEGLRELGAVDRAVYSAVAATPTPSLDEPLRRLSNAANNSRLWLAIAAGLAGTGGRTGRRAAVRGTLAIGRDQPWLGLALRFLAAAVAYSRVHTGVHYPGDVVAGALIGASTGQAVAGLMDRLPPAPRLAREKELRRLMG